MAKQGFNTIQELSYALDSRFTIDFAAAKDAAAKTNMLTEEITVNKRAVDLTFDNEFRVLKKSDSLNSEMQFQGTNAQVIRRQIEEYQNGIEMSLYDFESPEQQSQILNKVNTLVADLAWLRTRRIAEILKDGQTIPSYDGPPIFSNAHTINGFPFSNLLSGDLNADNFNAAQTALMNIPLGENGEWLPTEGAEFHLIVPPNLKFTAMELLESTTIPKAEFNSMNPYQGAATLHVQSQLQDPNDWYMLMTLPGNKPFVTVKHTESVDGLIPMIDRTWPDVVLRQMYRWGIRAVEETYAHHYFMMIKVANA